MIVENLSTLVSGIENGAKIVLPPSRSAPPMAATRALVETGVRDLHLVAMPTSGLQAELLIGAGCVSVVESAGITLDEFGQAPRFVAAVKEGSIKLKDSTCPALVSAIQAGEKGIPFIPMRGLLGTDLLKYREDYVVIDNPMTPDRDPIVLLPAIVPDFAIIHATLADQYGNVYIGRARELMTMAHAAKQTLVTVEEIIEDDLMADPLRSAATIPSLYISAVSRVEKGAAPYGLATKYSEDRESIAFYAKMAKTRSGFEQFLASDGAMMAAE